MTGARSLTSALSLARVPRLHFAGECTYARGPIGPILHNRRTFAGLAVGAMYKARFYERCRELGGASRRELPRTPRASSARCSGYTYIYTHLLYARLSFVSFSFFLTRRRNTGQYKLCKPEVYIG